MFTERNKCCLNCKCKESMLCLQAKGYEILYLTENVDEFALQVMMEYQGKKFKNVCADNIDVGTEKEKEELEIEFAIKIK